MTIDQYNKTVDLYSDNIYRFILKNLKDVERSKDVVQDTFEKLWMKRENVSYEKSKSYLFTAAYHTMIDTIRKQRNTIEISTVKNEYLTHNNQYSDLNEILNEAFNKLPETQRSVILLRDYEGYSYKEIEEITDLTEEQVKVYIYRARIFLKNYIGKIEVVI